MDPKHYFAKNLRKSQTLICLHGFLGSGADFDPLMPHFIQNEYKHIYCPDLDTDLEGVMEQIHSRIRGSAGGSVDLMGYSMGGRIALHFAHRYPHLIKNLTLISASPGIQNDLDRKNRLDADLQLARRLNEIGMRQFVDEWMQKPIIQSQQNIPKPIRDAMQQRRYKMNVDHVQRSLIHLGTGALPSLWDELDGIQTPTTLITGSLDEKFCEIAEQLLEKLPNAHHQIIPNVGHAPHLENRRVRNLKFAKRPNIQYKSCTDFYKPLSPIHSHYGLRRNHTWIHKVLAHRRHICRIPQRFFSARCHR